MPISGTSAAEIARSVRDLIAAVELAPQDALPPVRTLAEELGVNRNTVASAYRQLVAAGEAVARRRGGTAVAGMPQLASEGAWFGGRLTDLASGNPDPQLLPDALRTEIGSFPVSLPAADRRHPFLAGLGDTFDTLTDRPYIQQHDQLRAKDCTAMSDRLAVFLDRLAADRTGR